MCTTAIDTTNWKLGSPVRGMSCAIDTERARERKGQQIFIEEL